MEGTNTRDFAKIAQPIFYQMNWTYRGADESPCVDDIKATIDSLVDMVTDDNLTSAETGRIKVERRDEESSLDDHPLDVWLHLGSL